MIEAPLLAAMITGSATRLVKAVEWVGKRDDGDATSNGKQASRLCLPSQIHPQKRRCSCRPRRRLRWRRDSVEPDHAAAGCRHAAAAPRAE